MEPPWVEVLLAQHVVEHDSGPRHDVGRSLAVGQRQAGGVALGIDDADLGGAAACRRASQDLGAIGLDEIRAQQSGRVGAVLMELAVHSRLVRKFHDASQQGQVAGAAEGVGPDLRIAEQFQGEGDEDAAGRWRRIGCQAGVSVIQVQGSQLLDPVIGQIARREMTVPGAAVSLDALGDLAPIEQVLAFAHQGLDGVGKLGHDQDLALADGPRRVVAAGEHVPAGGVAMYMAPTTPKM